MIELSPGHGQRTEVPADYQLVAESWARGIMHTSRYPDTPVGDPVDWSVDVHDGSWLFRFHNMEYLFSIIRTLDETGDRIYQDLIARIVHSWIGAHPTPAPDTAPWMRHTTAMRAQALSFAAGYVPASEVYVGALRQHGEFLADPKNYSGAWNHGFDESLALLAVGATVGEQAWIDIAVQRASDAITAMCDLQGATNEQASVYHFYVWKQFGQFEEELDRCGIEHPTALRRRDAIVDFLVHASQPNSYLVAVGDSLGTLVPSIPGTPLEYTASQGQTGSPPSRRVKVFDRGWAFARTGWGTERAFEQESLLSLRYGPGRAVHGHSDHTSFHYFTGGRSVIGDAGFSGYSDPRRRAYELNEHAHSQVVVSGSGRYRPEVETQLLQHTEAKGWEQFVLSDSPYRGVERYRTISFVHEPECILLHDSVIVRAEKSVVRQLLHLAPTLELRHQQGQEGVVFADEHGELEIRQLVPVSNIDVTRGVRGMTTSGWVGVGLGRKAPGAVVTSRGSISAQHASFITMITPHIGVDVSMEAGIVRVGDTSVQLPAAQRGEIDG